MNGSICFWRKSNGNSNNDHDERELQNDDGDKLLRAERMREAPLGVGVLEAKADQDERAGQRIRWWPGVPRTEEHGHISATAAACLQREYMYRE